MSFSRRSGLILAVLLALPLMATAQDKQTQFELGLGIVISPDYRDVLDDVYPEYDLGFGGYGWLSFYGGMRLNVNNQFSVTPKLGLMVNFVIVDGGPKDETYMNTILVPAMAARYVFKDVPSLYVGGEVNYNLPRTGSDYYDLDSGGIGFGGFLGYVFEGGWHIETGYLNIPVEVGSREDNIGGGFLLRFAKAF